MTSGPGKKSPRKHPDGGWKRPAWVGLTAVALIIGALLIFRASDSSPEAASPGPGDPAFPSADLQEPKATVCKNQSPALIGIRVARPSPYPMTIDKKGRYVAQLSTSCGTMLIELFSDQAPIAVNNFINLARDDFYTAQVFHRIDRSLGIIQTGDPGCPSDVEDCGTGGPGYTLPDEYDNGLKPKVGSVVMTSAGLPDSSGSQFLIIADKAGLSIPRERTIFGQLRGRHSLQVAKLILSVPTKTAPNAPPSAPEDFPDGEFVYITGIKIK